MPFLHKLVGGDSWSRRIKGSFAKAVRRDPGIVGLQGQSRGSMTWRYCISQSSVPIRKKWFFHILSCKRIHPNPFVFFGISRFYSTKWLHKYLYLHCRSQCSWKISHFPDFPDSWWNQSYLHIWVGQFIFFQWRFCWHGISTSFGQILLMVFSGCWVVEPSSSKSSWSNADAPVRNEGLGRSQIANVAGNPSR